MPSAAFRPFLFFSILFSFLHLLFLCIQLVSPGLTAAGSENINWWFSQLHGGDPDARECQHDDEEVPQSTEK